MPEEKVIAPEVTKEINDLVAKGVKALEEFENLNQEQIDYIVAKCCVAGNKLIISSLNVVLRA